MEYILDKKDFAKLHVKDAQTGKIIMTMPYNGFTEQNKHINKVLKSLGIKETVAL